MGLSGGGAIGRGAARKLRITYRRARSTAIAARGQRSPDEGARWAQAYRSVRLEPTTVLYQSHGGAAMSCNPYAIFATLLADPSFAHFRHVWVLDNADEIARCSREYAGHRNVSFVRFKSPEYARALAAAGYLIQNTSFPSWFTKRPGQVYVNTWHSAGAVKKMGFDLPHGNYGVRNVLRNLLMADYIVSPNVLMTRMFTESYRLQGLYPGKLLEFGYPRNDVTANTPRAEVLDELRRRGVRVDPGKRIVLYAPTWRGTLSNVRGGADDLEQFRRQVSDGIDTDTYQILIKPHQYHYSRLTKEQKRSGRYIPRQFNANRLLAAVDVLISDYSSIFFDFMVTGRPVLFYVPDLTEYQAERGLYLTADQLPGPVTADPAEIAAWIDDLESTAAAYADRYARMRELACTHEDGNATRRTIDVVFRGREVAGVTDSLIDPGRERVLLYAPDLETHGATEALLTLLAGLDRERYDVTVAGIGHSPQSRENLERITGTRVLVRAGGAALTRPETYALEYLRRYGPHGWPARLLRFQPILDREWWRSFGEARFDTIVDFSRHPGIFAWMARLRGPARLIVRQHTDAAADLRDRARWRLTETGSAPLTRAALTAIYAAADVVAVPSPGLLEADRAEFPGARRFEVAESPVDAGRVRHLLAQAEEWRRRWRSDDGLIVADVEVAADGTVRTLQLPDSPPCPDSAEPYRRFVTMGTLAPHKNQAALIAAFADFARERPNARLFVIGSGPAEPELRQLADRPELAGRVCFTGHLRNPFTVLARADCFVLPSLYEGFSQSVAQARLAGLPIVLAGFASAASVSTPDGQLVTGSGAEDLHAALRAFAEGRVPPGGGFEVERHNASALAQWERLLRSR